MKLRARKAPLWRRFGLALLQWHLGLPLHFMVRKTLRRSSRLLQMQLVLLHGCFQRLLLPLRFLLLVMFPPHRFLLVGLRMVVVRALLVGRLHLG
jgi:hypothetical protein